MKEFVLKQLPFDDEWLVFWGGDAPEQNQHHSNTAQKFAFDFMKGDVGSENHSLDQTVFAVADGEVVEAVDGVRDNAPVETNDYMYLGNYVMIKHGGVYTVTAHLKQGSVCVKKGDKVTAGQKIGLCGNSGNSSESHVHFHAQDSFTFTRLNADYSKQPVANGVKIVFKKITVNGEIRDNYSPIKGDKVSNV